MIVRNENGTLPDGTWVRIERSGYRRSMISEYRGPLGPKGARIYRILVSLDPDPAYLHVREDQLEILEDQGDGSTYRFE